MRVGESLAQVADRVTLAAITPCTCVLLSCFRYPQCRLGSFSLPMFITICAYLDTIQIGFRTAGLRFWFCRVGAGRGGRR